MTSHPIDLVYVDGSPVSKSFVRSYSKARERLRMADANEVRNTSLSGHFGGVYISSLQTLFDIDTADTTTADDGVNTIIDFDGNRWKRVVFSVAETQRVITAAGDVTLAADDEDIIVINKTVGAATQVELPDAALRTKAIRIVDGKYDALTNNITVVPKAASGQLIFGASSWIIDGNGGSVKLTPLADGSGWI